MHPLDTLLTGGGIAAAGPTPVYDLYAGRRRIAVRLADRRAVRHADGSPAGRRARGRDESAPARPLPGAAVPADRGADAGPRERPVRVTSRPEDLTVHDYADRDLLALSGMVISEDWASAALHRLGRGHDRLDPRGALVFACLLYLVGRYQEAQFWWQFAGGAEEPTACYCLYLHHARLGDLKAAQHWFLEAARLELRPPGRRPPDRTGPPPTVPQLADYYLACLPMVSDYVLPRTAPGASQPPDSALREALDDLEPVRDAEYGPISLPNDDLADHLHDLATAT
ncbi:hypothetical protein ACFRMQ_21410 [Kitasatospora sp. NPDC056783]|uniref:hypothetical protein n=1 Tax=Kitasatospora sp. NPDC056783 TaxID=3345943 RepID=UPI00368B19AB